MKKETAKTLRVFLIELAIYAVLVVAYFFLVLHFLGEGLQQLEQNHRFSYAVIAILGGFFGVGGSFIAGPALRAVGLDWNFAIGTDLAHIVGKSVVAVQQHRAF